MWWCEQQFCTVNQTKGELAIYLPHSAENVAFLNRSYPCYSHIFTKLFFHLHWLLIQSGIKGNSGVTFPHHLNYKTENIGPRQVLAVSQQFIVGFQPSSFSSPSLVEHLALLRNIDLADTIHCINWSWRCISFFVFAPLRGPFIDPIKLKDNSTR